MDDLPGAMLALLEARRELLPTLKAGNAACGGGIRCLELGLLLLTGAGCVISDANSWKIQGRHLP